LTDLFDIIRRSREAAAADRKWTTAPPRDALLDELAAALEQTIRERDGYMVERAQQHGAANRYRARWLEEKERADRAEAALAQQQDRRVA
jgi:hypothetical protein